MLHMEVTRAPMLRLYNWLERLVFLTLCPSTHPKHNFQLVAATAVLLSKDTASPHICNCSVFRGAQRSAFVGYSHKHTKLGGGLLEYQPYTQKICSRFSPMSRLRRVHTSGAQGVQAGTLVGKRAHALYST